MTIKHKQCRHCPWRVDADLNQIPGYCPTQHRNLKKTIATPGEVVLDSLTIMVCHKSARTNDKHIACVGWLHNQLGAGNNIALRWLYRGLDMELSIEGQQYSTLEETYLRLFS
jgi:hypothetical protein